MHHRVSLAPSAALALKFGVLLGLLSLLVTLPVLAGAFTAFGPQNFTRTMGGPVTVTKSFPVQNPSTSYTLRINNGGLIARGGSVSGRRS